MAKKKVGERCLICGKFIEGEFYYRTHRRHLICSEDCKNYYFSYSTATEKVAKNFKLLLMLWTAICTVETGNDSSKIGDDGESIGIAQIQRGVILDVNKFRGGKYVHADAKSDYLSQLIFISYLLHWGDQYEKDSSQEVTNEVYARIWNGGPYGYKKKSTQKYWEKIQNHLP